MGDARTGRASTWSVILGVILIALGVIATTSPLFATMTLIKMIGWVLIIAAIDQAVDAFRSRGEGGIFLKVFLAAVYGIVAIMLLRRPTGGAAAATVIVGILFLLDGVTEIALAIRTRRTGRRSGWLFAGGAISLLFGAVILYRFPLSALWTIGLLVGIRLIVKGIEQITSSLPDTRLDIQRPGGLKRAA